MSKKSIRVLDLCEDEQSRFAWKHAWLTNSKIIDDCLQKKDICLSTEIDTNNPIATVDKARFDAKLLLIRKTFDNHSRNMKVEQRPLHLVTHELKDKIIKQSRGEIGIYEETENSIVWIVGESLIFADVVNMFLPKSQIEQVDESPAFDGFENIIEPSYVTLSKEEKAVMWLYSLFNLKCLKSENVNLKCCHFDVIISAPDEETKRDIEKEIRRKISDNHYTVVSRVLSFTHARYKFLLKNEVHEFVEKRSQRSINKIGCVWFPEDNNMIKVYTSDDATLDLMCRIIQDCIQEDSVHVPSCYFRTDTAKQKLKEYEDKQKGKLSLNLSSSCSTVNVIHTSDVLSPVAQIRSLSATKTLHVPNEVLKLLLGRMTSDIEERHTVKVQQKDGNGLYCFIITGEISSVNSAYRDLQKMKDSSKTKRNSYITDEKLEIVRSKIKAMEEKIACTLSEMPYTFKIPGNVIDMKERIPCQSLNMSGGFTVAVYQCRLEEHSWLKQNSMVVNVSPVPSNQLANINVEPDMKNEYLTATFFLPDWRGNANKERECLYNLVKEVTSIVTTTKDQIKSISFDLSEVDKVKWPKIKYLKYTLGAIQELKPKISLCFYDCCTNIGETASVIQEWCKAESEKSFPRIHIHVRRDELAKMQCDVLVNSTGVDLQLDKGTVSNSLLKTGGDELQFACNRYLSSKQKQIIKSAEVVVTDGYRLSCHYVFHGTLPRYGMAHSNQALEKLVENCLQKAVEKNVKSIAFPALGTGQLCYPEKDVAARMFKTVQHFISNQPTGSLCDIYFVIYPKDDRVVKAFEDQELKHRNTDLRWNAVDVASPDNVFFDVCVAGADDIDIERSFQDIEQRLKQRDIHKSPVSPEAGMISHSLSEPLEQIIDHFDRESAGKGTHSTGETLPGEAPVDSNASLENTFIPDETKASKPQNEVCYLEVHMTRINEKSIYRDLLIILKKYDVHEEQIIWNEATPYQARLKLQSELVADQLLSRMKNEWACQIMKCNADAVVNIKAKLSSCMNGYLMQEKDRFLLQKQSGVCIEKCDDSYILVGDLTAISAARDILVLWKNTNPLARENTIVEETGKNSINPGTGYDEVSELNGKGVVVSDTSNPQQRSVCDNSGSLKVKLYHKQESANGTNQVEKKLSGGDGISQQDKKFPSAFGDNLQNPELGGYSSSQDTPQKLYPDLSDENNETGPKSFDKTKGAVPKTYSQYNNCNTGGDTALVQHKVNMGGKNVNTEGFPREGNLTENQNTSINKTRTKHFWPQDEALMMTTKEGIKVFVYVAEYCRLDVDCIVNSSNADMKVSGGLSAVIAKEAGREMIDECQNYIDKHKTLDTNKVCVTSAGRLSNYKSILHVNGPKTGNIKHKDFSDALSSSVRLCLEKANELCMRSCALPAIGSGYGGIPKDICYNAYPKGVLKFSKKHGKKFTLKAIHFVDIDQDVVNCMRVAFLSALADESNESWQQKWKRLPGKAKAIFKSHIRNEAQAGKYLELHPANNVIMVVCDGALLKSSEHPHLMSVIKGRFKKWKNEEESALVITNDVYWNGKSRSVNVCRSRDDEKFNRNYNFFKDKKKSIGSALKMHAGNFKFSHVICSVLPKLSQEARKKKTPEQDSFFQMLDTCYKNILVEADCARVKHLAMPLFCSDFYTDCTEEWFWKLSIRRMVSTIRAYADSRKEKDYMIVHIVTDGNDKLFHLLGKELRFESIVEETTV